MLAADFSNIPRLLASTALRVVIMLYMEARSTDAVCAQARLRYVESIYDMQDSKYSRATAGKLRV